VSSGALLDPALAGDTSPKDTFRQEPRNAFTAATAEVHALTLVTPEVATAVFCDQCPQQPRGWQGCDLFTSAAGSCGGATFKRWSKRAEFIGRGCGRSPTETGLCGLALELSLDIGASPRINAVRPSKTARNGKEMNAATKSWGQYIPSRQLQRSGENGSF